MIQNIVVVNESTVLTDDQVRACVLALQEQITADFSKYYNFQALVTFLPKGTPVKLGWWELVIADDSDQADALGYHETTVNGDPIGYVFARSDLESSSSWTVTASHELLEMCGDPDIQTVEEQDNGDGSTTLRMKEVCDPCEDDSLAYASTVKLPDGTAVLLSDFVTPDYWNPNALKGVPLDFCGHITSPLQILSGGYIGILNVPKSIQWSQIDASLKPGGKAEVRGNRRARRQIPDKLWRHSER